MNTQQERDHMDGDKIKSAQSDDAQSQNRQAASLADQKKDKWHEDEQPKSDGAQQKEDRLDVQKDGPLK